ncbi:hypothetical protein BH11MYX4_BH11MYX4_32640 [soil metagenome]
MMSELAARFFIGGVVVALLALVGEAFETKTFSGLFGAAPSVSTLVRSVSTLVRSVGAVALVLGSVAWLVVGCSGWWLVYGRNFLGS